jgi:hypothetical protein
VLKNDPAHVANLMLALIQLTITQNKKQALDWLSEGMRKSIDEGKSEFIAGDAVILVEFIGTKYILTISPSR